jgi:periplasmic protein TonB
MEEARTALEMVNRIACKTLVPVTASVLIHAGLVAAIVLGSGWAPVGMPMLIAELVEDEAPPAVTPTPPAPKPIVRDRRPVTPPRPIAAPVPEPPAPSRPEPEPPKPVVPEPPRPVAPEPPKPSVAEPPAAPAPEPSRTATSASSRVPTSPGPPTTTEGVAGPSISAAPEPGSSAFALPSQAPARAGDGGSPSMANGPVVAAIPPDGVTQRAIPRGGYQYRPAYPSSARNLGIQGTTLLHVLVSDTGRVAEVVVKQSAGHPDLDRAATDAVRRWRFEPARRGTEPVEMWVQLPFEFRLR